MKIQFTLPTNNDFFNRYATLIPTLSKLGIISQIISAFTEIGIIYSIILSRVYEIAPNNAELLATIGAIIGTAFLEIGLRKFTPYSIKAFLYQRFKGLDLAMTIFILLVCIGLFCGSATLSFSGSKELVKIASPTPMEETTTATDSTYNNKKRELIALFVSDSATIANGYIKQIRAETIKYNSLIVKQQSDLNQYNRKEQRTGLSYTTRKETIRGKMASLQAEQATKIAAFEALQAKELKNLTSSRKNDLKAIERLYLSQISKIDNTNALAIEKSESTTIFWKWFGMGFTIICLCVFLFSVIIEEIHKKGSGINQIAVPNQYHFSESVLSDFFNMVADKVNFKLRSKIQTLAEATPPPPIPLAPPNLYDLTGAEQQRLIFTLANTTDQHYLLNNNLPQIDTNRAQRIDSKAPTTTIRNEGLKTSNLDDLEQKILNYLNAFYELEKCNLHSQAEEMRLKADDVIKAYLGKDATKENVTNLRNEIIGFINGENPNPFEKEQRTPIGFNKEFKENGNDTNTLNLTIQKSTIRKSLYENSVSTNQRTCNHCGKTYIYRHHKQKYCKDECRIDAWQKRTGKRLQLKKKK